MTTSDMTKRGPSEAFFALLGIVIGLIGVTSLAVFVTAYVRFLWWLVSFTWSFGR